MAVPQSSLTNVMHWPKGPILPTRTRAFRGEYLEGACKLVGEGLSISRRSVLWVPGWGSVVGEFGDVGVHWSAAFFAGFNGDLGGEFADGKAVLGGGRVGRLASGGLMRHGVSVPMRACGWLVRHV